MRYWCTAPKKISKPLDILFSVRAPVGPTNINTIEACIGRGLAAIRCGASIDLNFLLHFLRANEKKIAALGTGSTFKAITISELKKLQIPLPPLETQKKIAAILDAAEALRKKTQQTINQYDLLAQSIFLDMFGDPVTNPKGWEKNRVSEICEKIQIGPFGSQLHQSDYLAKGIPLINPINIVEKRIDLGKAVFISKEKYDRLPNYHLKQNDVIMARRGDLSKVGLVNTDSSIFCGTGSLYIRFKEKVNGVFIHRLLSDESTTNYLLSKAQGITMPNLNKSIIADIPIHLPPIALQTQFAEKIDLIEQQKELAKKSLARSEDLFNALLQKAFKGELVNQ